MREIKFRAWDIKNEILVYPDEDGNFEFIVEGCRMRSDQDLWSIVNYTYDDLIPMQYTGLKDKNNNDIYEGDIIDYGNGRNRPV